MVIDSSALIALLLAGSETPAFIEAIAAAPRRLVGAPSYLETAIVMISRLGPEAREQVERLLVVLRIEIIPFTREQAVLAIAAFQRYGKGTGHAAGLNLATASVMPSRSTSVNRFYSKETISH
jgi:ribonuclease VapC